jgi:hypothetical protein
MGAPPAFAASPSPEWGSKTNVLLLVTFAEIERDTLTDELRLLPENSGNPNRPVAVEVLLERGLVRLQGGAVSRDRAGRTGEVSAAVGCPDRIAKRIAERNTSAGSLCAFR